MQTITAIAAKKLGKFIAKDFRGIFGPAHDEMAERLGSFARSTIECLARSDALYHNYEHTLQVTIVGRDILAGMTLTQRIEPLDYLHLIVSCLLHDIGYVRGILSGDTENEIHAADGRDHIRSRPPRERGGARTPAPRTARRASALPDRQLDQILHAPRDRQPQLRRTCCDQRFDLAHGQRPFGEHAMDPESRAVEWPA